MKLIEKSINNLEIQYNNKKNKKRLIMLLNKYYLGFLTTEKTDYLNKAYNHCVEYLNKNQSDMDIMLGLFFFTINIDDKEKIEIFNNNISKYKKYLKNNDVEKYLFYLFLQGLIKAKKNSIRGVNKYIKALQNFESKNISLYIAYLSLSIDSSDREVLNGLDLSLKTSFWKNIFLYYIFEKNSKFISFNKQVYMEYIKWALYNGLNIEKSIFRYESSLTFDYKENMFNKKIYEEYSFDFILSKICNAYLEKNIHTNESYFFFKEAINRQILLPNLIFSYIKACYKSKIEHIGLYPIKQFLNEPINDLEIMSFVYHIILSNKKYINLVIEHKKKILQYGAYFLEKGCLGKYYYTIYKYMLDFVEEGSLEERKILDALYPNNFLYEINIKNNLAKVILIKDYEIDNIKEYEIKNNKVIIKVSSPNFYYYIFSKDKKELLNSQITISKFIEGANGKYFYKFYKRGYTDDLTLINTIKYYLNLDNIGIDKIDIFEKTLNLKNISLNFKMQILLSIGNIYFYNNNYNLAVSYYKKVLEKYINDKYVNNIVKAYISCKEYEKSIEIIKKKAHILDDDILFYAIKNISENEKYDKDIAIFVYELLMRSKIDNLFIDIVLREYKGGLREWIELRKTLENMGIIKKEIDEYILKLTIYTNSMNSYSEKIFLTLYYQDIENVCIEYFLNYCIYIAINGNYKFSNDVVYIMEYIFKETNDNMIGYALGHIYLKCDYSLEDKLHIFENILDNMEKEQICFKIFENNKDKFKNFSYLYKNKPFIYKSAPNKDVYIYYKNINQDKFLSLKMKYFKFGMYICNIPVFYGENIEYYFIEKMEKGDISTKKFTLTNNQDTIFNLDDKYFKINNAFIYTYEGRYNEAQQLIEELIKKDYNLKGKLL